MKLIIEFDPAKSAKNATERSLPFAKAQEFDFETAMQRHDLRRDYKETRIVAYGMIGKRLHVLCYKPKHRTIFVSSVYEKQINARKNAMRKKQKPLINENGEVRPLRKGETTKFTPLRDSFPELAAYAKKRKAGRPKSAAPKQLQSFKLSPDVIAAIRGSGAGYNARVEVVLREAISEGRI